jgi:release factor glutamine methyltransferase
MHTDPRTGQSTIAGLLRESARVLRSTSESARLDAELLLAHVLGRSRVQLYGSATDPVRPEVAARFIDLVHKRREGRPVAQILGSREFWSMKMTVTRDTLIPRPETELLVECALKRLPRRPEYSVLELGTGSGAIALALAEERPNAQITATDISEAALAVARYNAGSYELGNIDFLFGDWFGPVRNKKFAAIVSNPPYVTDKEWLLHYFELHYEPSLALRGGRDGLMAIRHIVTGAADHLLPGGWLLVEHGFRQGPAVANLFQENGFTQVSTYRDLPGHPRVTEGQFGELDRD